MTADRALRHIGKQTGDRVGNLRRRLAGFVKLKDTADLDATGAAAGRPWEIDPKAPYDTAKLMVQAQFTDREAQIVHRHRGGFHLWNGTAYPEIEDAAMRAAAYGFLDRCFVSTKQGEPVQPNSSKVNQLLDALCAVTHLPAEIEMPAWLGEAPADLDARDIIACANGLLHLPTEQLLPHTPAYFCPNALDFAYDPHAARPAEWFKFLNELWSEDSDSIATLQEMFGYSLAPTPHDKKCSCWSARNGRVRVQSGAFYGGWSGPPTLSRRP